MILVTGGAGFIGSNLIAGLNRSGRNDIIVIDHLAQGDKFRNLSALDYADLYDREQLDFVLEVFGDQIEVIFHQGACSATTERNADYLLHNNFEVSKTLFTFAQNRKIPYIYASSASVYGNGDCGFAEERRAEEPLNAYAFSKHLFDLWVRQQWPRIQSQVVGLRYFNVYGPQENHKGRMASVIWQFHQQLTKDGVLRIFEGSDTFLRDFIHVEDVVRALIHLWQSPRVSGIFNLGTGEARSFMEIAETMAQSYDGRIETIPFPDDLRGKYQVFTQADITRLQGTGFDMQFKALRTGVLEYCHILKDHQGLLQHPSKV